MGKIEKTLTVTEWIGVVLLVVVVLPAVVSGVLLRLAHIQAALEQVEEQQIIIDNLQRQLPMEYRP